MKIQNIDKTFFLVCMGVLIGCSESGDGDTLLPQSKRISEINIPQFEGSRSNPIQSVTEENTGVNSDEVHQGVKKGVKIDRIVFVPKEVEGKWKAVKIMVRNKIDETRSSIQTASLGSNFELEGTAIKVTVGSFMPNFVMTKTNYTSKGNDLTNPAVQLVVEENGKTLYEGWAFAKYPKMYAFEHEEFAFQLMDYIPADIS